MHALKTAVLNDKESVILTDEEVHLIQNRLLCVLDDFLDICNTYDIPYMMGGGTALGTVRHHGFIPWDDDIDVNMCRKDAQRFLPLFKEKYGEKYWIYTPGEAENTYSMIHILTKDVRCRGIMQPKTDHWGICFDIFLIENTYDNSLLRKIHGYTCMAYRYALSCMRFARNKAELNELAGNGSELSGYIRKRTGVSKVLSVLPLSVWSKRADRCMGRCRDEHSRLVSIPAGQKQYFGEMYEREKYCKLTEMEFEGRTVKISADYDAYLKKLYGNYMEVPPAEKREKHVVRELDKEALKKYEGVKR